MKKITLRMYALVAGLLAFFMCVPVVSAADYPTLTELYGRYTFNGTMTSMTEELGEEALEPMARTGYTMVVVPGEAENEVQILGFWGYGGGLKAIYNQAEGTLHCEQNAFFVCSNTTVSKGIMVVVDAGVGKLLDLTFKVESNEGQIVITAENPITTTSFTGSSEYDKWTYAAGYTLTKQDVTVPVTEAAGTYDFESDNVLSTMLGGVYEFFDLVIRDKGNGKVGVSGLFDLEEEIEADYFSDGGILMLPYDYVYENEMFMGDNEEYMQFRREPAPWLLFGDRKVTSPSSFILCGGYDDALGNPILFSFQGGEGAKTKDGDSVDKVQADNGVTVVSGKGKISVSTPEVAAIKVYDTCGVLVGETVASSAGFDALAAGIYVVKVAEQTVKTVVK